MYMYVLTMSFSYTHTVPELVWYESPETVDVLEKNTILQYNIRVSMHSKLELNECIHVPDQTIHVHVHVVTIHVVLYSYRSS